MLLTTSIVDSLMDKPEAIEIFKEFQNRVLDEQKRREEFYNWVTDDIKAEFINGEIIIHSPVQSRHAQVSDNLFTIFKIYVQKHQLGRVTHEKVMTRFTRNDYEPDVMFFGNEKAATIKPTQSLFPIPDFVIEILSDSTAERDRGVKFRDYENHQVPEYWIVDVENEVVEQYIIKNGQYELIKKTDEGVIHCSVVKGLDFSVEAIFDENKQFEFLQTIIKGQNQ